MDQLQINDHSIPNEFVIAAERHVGTTGSHIEWSLLGGLDRNSVVWDAGEKVVKVRQISPFEAKMLMRALSDIHSKLAPAHLVPRLLSIQYDGRLLVSVFERISVVGSLEPTEVGFVLGRAHSLLAGVPVRKTSAWSGYYGEYREFRFLIPIIEDESIRQRAEQLLPIACNRELTQPVHYIHRDLNPNNVLVATDGIRLIDWDMTHGGHREDDVAMALCCLSDLSIAGAEVVLAADFLHGYREALPTVWSRLDHPLLRSAIALAGLRQAVAGWFSDEGDTSAKYWKNIHRRLEAACTLTGVSS